MKEELKTKLQETATELLDFVNNSKDFVLEQTPLYVQEVVEFHFIDNALSAGMCGVFILCVLIITAFSSYKVYKVDRSDWGIEWITLGAILILIVVLTHIMGERLIEHSKECYKAKYAPRVLIIEKLSELKR